MARHANDREVWLNLRDAFPHPYTREHAVAFLTLVMVQDPPLDFAIDLDGTCVGGITLMPGDDIERRTCEVGYWLGRAAWGRGLATAAVREITTYAFRDLRMHRVFAAPFAHNAASCRVLEKAGYTREGVMRRSVVKDGKVLDQVLYATCDDRWE